MDFQSYNQPGDYYLDCHSYPLSPNTAGKGYTDNISPEDIREIRRQQTITWLQIFTWIITVTAVWVASLTIMSDFGVDITPFLASVGIAGFNCSIEAPTLIKDFIGGFLMLFENQFMIGDTIQLGDLRGTEEGITLRTTYARDGRWFNYTTPNGQIRI